MNKLGDFRPGRGRREGSVGRAARVARARKATRGAVARPLRGGGPLTKAAQRLLFALTEAGARAVRDSTEGGFLLVRKECRGVAVGGGRHREEAAEMLVRHDLACWDEAHKALKATGAGHAHRKRRDDPGEAPFLAQHVETGEAIVETPAGPSRVTVDLEESPLDWLRRRKGRDGQPLIDAACHEAGERLRADITLAGLLPGVTARWDLQKGMGRAGPTDATDRMVAARQRVRQAFDAVGGDFADLLMDLCGFLKGLETIERERQWPVRSAKIVVRLALSRLSEHYGLTAASHGPSTSRGIRAWRAVVIDGGRS